MDWTLVSKSIETFLAAPFGKLVLFIIALSIALWGFYALRRLEVANARNEREAKLEQAKISHDENEDIRRSTTNANISAAIKELADARTEDIKLRSRMLTILERMESQGSHTHEIVRDVKEIAEANAIKTTAIHKDLRASATNLNNSLSLARKESERRSEVHMQIMNNRAQEIQKTVIGSEQAVIHKVDEHGLLFDRVLDAMGDINNLIKALHKDFNINVEAQAHREMGRMQQGTEVLNRFSIVEDRLNEVMAVVYLLKKRGDTKPLDPSKAPAKTEELPPPPPTITPHVDINISAPVTPPKADEPRLTPPVVHDTQPLDINKVTIKPEGTKE